MSIYNELLKKHLIVDATILSANTIIYGSINPLFWAY
jgi:hypothetical protein